MELQEGLAEAGGEGRGGLGDAALGDWFGVRMDTGGSTPKASALRKITCLAAGPWLSGRTIFSMW